MSRAHHRRSLRLPGSDYAAPGGYFVTVVAFHRQCLFGDMDNGILRLNPLGEIVRQEWFQTAALRPYVELCADEFIVMPNHIHGIIWIIENDDRVGARRRRAPTEERFGAPVTGSIPTIVRAFKSAVTTRAHHARLANRIWQRNYYEHILRDQKDYEAIAAYILANPARWNDDEENPTASRH